MAGSLVWRYGLVGVVVAGAVIVVTGTAAGLTDGEDEEPPRVERAVTPSQFGEGVVSSEVVTTATGEQVEYVYVDQPASPRGHDDDDEYDEHEDGEHEDDEHEDDD